MKQNALKFLLEFTGKCPSSSSRIECKNIIYIYSKLLISLKFNEKMIIEFYYEINFPMLRDIQNN